MPRKSIFKAVVCMGLMATSAFPQTEVCARRSRCDHSGSRIRAKAAIRLTSPADRCIPDCTGMGSDIDFDDVLSALVGFTLLTDCP